MGTKNNSKQLMIVYFGMFATQFANMVYPMLTLLIRDKLGMSATHISYFLALNFVMLAIASFAGGTIADKFNKKKTVILFDLISVVLYIIGGMIPFSYFTVVLIIAAGMFQQLEIAPYSMIVNELAEDGEKDKAFSTLYMSINVGAFLSASASGFLILKHTSLVFWLNAGGILLSALVLLFGLDYEPKPTPAEEESTGSGGGLKELADIMFRTSPMMIYLVMVAVSNAVHDEYAYIIPLEIERVFKDGSSEIYGTMISASCLIIIIFTKIMAEVMHKKPHTTKMRASNLAQGLGYGVIFIGFIKGILPLLYVGFVIYIFGEIFDSLYYEAYMVSKVPEEHCGQIYGLFSAVIKVAAMGADLLTGKLYDADPSKAWMLIFGMVIITLILTEVIRIKESRIQIPGTQKPEPQSETA